MVEMQTLSQTAYVDEIPFPLYIGFLTAAQLKTVTDVPSFDEAQTNAEIARNVLNPPLKDWQRPLMADRAQAITERFDQPGELMPNPILVAVHDYTLIATRAFNNSGQSIPITIFDIQDDRPEGSRPLWILDGQHRVEGLANSRQADNPIPVVVLYDPNRNYKPEQFARIFAEVTTQATALAPLHNAWLKYAFRLEPYQVDDSGEDSTSWKAMDAVARLCENTTFKRQANIFHDKIQFNPVDGEPTPAHENGFAYTAIDLKDLLNDHYYKQRVDGTPLEPEDLAAEISLSLRALKDSVTTESSKCVFWGDQRHISIYPQNAFLHGVCTHLRLHGVPTSWRPILERLKFNQTNWDFSTWTQTTGGESGTHSKKVISRIFCEAFEQGGLWDGIQQIPQYLQGSKAQLEFELKYMGPQRALRHDVITKTFPTNGTEFLTMEGRQYIKLLPPTSNVAKIEVKNKNELRNTDFSYSKLRAGVPLETGHDQTELSIISEFYGGKRHEVEVKILFDG